MGIILSLIVPVSQIPANAQSFSETSGPLDCRSEIPGFKFERATYQQTGLIDMVSCIYDNGIVSVSFSPIASGLDCDNMREIIDAQVNSPEYEVWSEQTSKTHFAFSIFAPVGLSEAAEDLILQVEKKNLASECTIPFVTTRGHTEEFAFDDPIIKPGFTNTGYGTSGNIPGFETDTCPSEVVIYIHGFQNSHINALENLVDTQNSLNKNNYSIPIIGFSWDSDTGYADFTDAGLIAKLNGPKLAEFIKDYKNQCSNTKIRLMSHSLGAQVVLSTLESLHDDKKWNSCGYGKDKITSIHVLGAAVPNTTVSKQTNSYGNAIESEVGIFHNKFNNEDTVLSVGYTIGGSGQALGEEGASSVSNKPSNYNQQDVTKEVGNDHSGYNKESSSYNSNDPEKDGVIDDVVRDWRTQKYTTHPSCGFSSTPPEKPSEPDGSSVIAENQPESIDDQLNEIEDKVGQLGDTISEDIGQGIEGISDVVEDIPIGEIEDKAKEVIDQIPDGGGCLIATATYGSELAPQVQQLRELRDNYLLQTQSGKSFMTSFNEFYYSFSPGIADFERENPLFRETVKIVITPMISSLSVLNHVNMQTEAEVLGYGISMILLNIGMYIGIPAMAIIVIKKKTLTK